MNLEDTSDKVERKEEKKEGRKRQKRCLKVAKEEILKVAKRLTIKMVFVSYTDLLSPIAPLDSTLLYFRGEKNKEHELGWEVK